MIWTKGELNKACQDLQEYNRREAWIVAEELLEKMLKALRYRRDDI